MAFGGAGDDVDEDEPEDPFLRWGPSLPQPVADFLASSQGTNLLFAFFLTFVVGGIAAYWFYTLFGNPFNWSK